jgi:hypothetical protein
MEKKLKRGDEIKVKATISILQKHPIEGMVTFDSWEDDERIYVTIPNEPIGKRFMIYLKDVVTENVTP